MKGLVLFVLLSNLPLIIIHTMAILNGVETAAAWWTVVISVVFVGWSGIMIGKEDRAVSMG
ncbi:MAG: hypothetical protein KKG00_08590 [Bacteroidetes bacterium]|nr:hypothetical protein [Bacteroidota bacterium]